MNVMAENKPEQGAIQLDNQCIQLRILMPSGRFHVTDKVSGAVWSMKAGNSSGMLTVLSEGGETLYKMGGHPKTGISFSKNFYMVRSTATEDYHDVSLSGTLGEDKNTLVTIRYLLSTTFPVLNCFCYVSGMQAEQVQKIQFPLGLRSIEDENHRVLLPQEIKPISSEIDSEVDPLWEPPTDREHRIVGSPFFILTQRLTPEKSGGCIGFLQHPLSMLEIHQGKQERFVHPLSSRLDVTGKSEKKPYSFRYQFVPSDDLEALSWLYKEYLMEPIVPIEL